MGKREEDIRKRCRRSLIPYNPVAMMYKTRAGKGTPPGMKRPVEFLPKGWPDDMLLIRGRLAGLELKSENDRLRHDQAVMARNWRCAGIPIVYPRTGDDLLDLLCEVFPPEVLAPPTEEEWALYREAISPKWKDDPKGWLRHRGWLPKGV